MLVQLGSRPPPQDVVDVLLECHERIRRFCALTLHLGGDAAMTDDEVAQAAHFLGVYFTEALPLHDSDEMVVLLPRLKGFSDDVDAALQLMSQDHLEHAPRVESLVSLARRLEAQPGARRDVKADLLAVGAELTEHFDQHLSLEESSIFPAARAFLSNDVLAEMLAEVRARRR